MHWGLRFDFRNPDIAGTTMAERYAAALDMVEWAEGLGASRFIICEHHGSQDGYIPSPLPMAAAMATRTKKARIGILALIVPFHDPLRLAEDISVVDNIANGRLDIVVAAGYNPIEFAMFDVPMKERVARVTETVETLRAAFSGEPFEFRGRVVQVTPKPVQTGGPKIVLGGSSEAAARRAARIADGFAPTVTSVWDAYRDELIKRGKPDVGPARQSHLETTFLAEDVDEGWAKYGPYFLHEMNAYGAWQQGDVETAFRPVEGVDELRSDSHYRVMTPQQLVAEAQASPVLPFLMLHPLCGGTPPDLAWESLRLFAHDVLPHVRSEADRA
jgi:alkanesulfonate monooxygenase SsuD/methylene tetrahydromethanopterin reductase-like flavin-dependent oxidoreductase (luciferase family)